MTSAEEQKQKLRSRLYQELKYRETFEEIYDHILTGVEHQKTTDFTAAANDIINEDFGGFGELRQIEQKTFDAVRKASGAKYKQYLLRQIIGFEILLTVCVGAGIYMLASRQPQTMNIIAIATSILFCLPRFINWGRHFRLGYVFKDKKSSLRDEVFGDISTTPFSHWFWSNTVALIFFGSFSAVYSSPIGLAIMFTMAWVLLFAFIKLYRDELKMTVFA